MAFLNKFLGQFKAKKSGQPDNPLVALFKPYQNDSDSPPCLAKNGRDLILECPDKEEVFYAFVEDAIFSSLYATVYEQMLLSLASNPDLALQLIDNFGKHQEEREQLLWQQTHEHLQFIQSNGQCPGCSCCENHADVIDLIPAFNEFDMTFYQELYIGMQSIQFAMEQLLYEFIPDNPELINLIDSTNIFGLRKHFFELGARNCN